MANLNWSGINTNVDTGDEVEAKLTASFNATETALTDLETTTSGFGTRLSKMIDAELDAKSFVTQEPTLVDTPIQISFGSEIVNTNVSVDVNGTITFRTAGKYSVNIDAMYGRNGSSGVSIMHYRALVNDTQVGNTLTAKLDSVATLIPFTATYFVEAAANDTMKFEFYLDADGNNSGGLFATTVGLGWNNSPSAAIVVRNA